MSKKQDLLSALSILAGWLLSSASGWAAGLASGAVLSLASANIHWINQDHFSGVVTMISLGICLGVAQWVIMRRYLPRPSRWVSATLIGFLLCLAIIVAGNLARLERSGLWDDVLLMGLLGCVIGSSQWWVLRKRYRQAGLWVLANVVGFLCFLFLIAHPASSMGEFILRGTITGTLAAVMPAAMLAWLAHKRDAKATSR